jgi:hypothetical protein
MLRFSGSCGNFDLEGTCGHRGETHNCHPLRQHHHGGRTTPHRKQPLRTDHTVTVAGGGVTDTGGVVGASFTYKARESVSVTRPFRLSNR